MGELIHLPTRRADRPRPTAEMPAAFFFDVSRSALVPGGRVTSSASLGEVEWVAVDGAALRDRAAGEAAAARAAPRRRARSLRLPLVWPDAFPAGVAVRAARRRLRV